MKMKPLQLWLPSFGRTLNFGPVSRDARRAFEAWDGELIIWMLPEIKRLVRWRSGGVKHLAVPSEEFEKIDVLHIDDSGTVYAPEVMGELPRTIEGLLEAWLNVGKTDPVAFVPAPEHFPILAPVIRSNNGVLYTVRNLGFGAGTFLPVASVDLDGREVTLKLTKEGAPSPISFEAESSVRFAATRAPEDGRLVMTEDGERALHVFLRWPPPVDRIMPLLSSLDDIKAQAHMSKVASLSSIDRRKALRLAELEVQPHSFNGLATVRHSLIGKGLDHILFIAEDQPSDRGLKQRSVWRRRKPSIDDLLKIRKWRDWLESMVPTRRVWGATGLFWTLLLDNLNVGQSFAQCENCGRLFSGKKGKRFCGENDDPQCFRKRRAVDQRRSRLGQKS
jgi:hypothetical protein